MGWLSWPHLQSRSRRLSGLSQEDADAQGLLRHWQVSFRQGHFWPLPDKIPDWVSLPRWEAAHGTAPLSSTQRRSLGLLLQHVAVRHQRPQEVREGQRLWQPFHRLHEDADAQRLHAWPIYFHFREIPETAKKWHCFQRTLIPRRQGRRLNFFKFNELLSLYNQKSQRSIANVRFFCLRLIFGLNFVYLQTNWQ